MQGPSNLFGWLPHSAQDDTAGETEDGSEDPNGSWFEASTPTQ